MMLERTCKQCGNTKPFDTTNWYTYKGHPSGNTCRTCYNQDAKRKRQQQRATPEGLGASRKYRNDYYARVRAQLKTLPTVPKKRGRPQKAKWSPIPLIYSLTWPGTLARYVGQTTDLSKRLYLHRIPNNWRLQTAYELHGAPTVTILEYVPNAKNLTARERYWIDKLASTNIETDGLNMS